MQEVAEGKLLIPGLPENEGVLEEEINWTQGLQNGSVIYLSIYFKVFMFLFLFYSIWGITQARRVGPEYDMCIPLPGSL